MTRLRLRKLEEQAKDHETRLRALQDSATQFKMLASLATGGGLLSVISDSYDRLFKVTAPDVSARDNSMLADAATGIANAMQSLESLLQSNTTPEFKSLVTDMILKFAGERPEEKVVQQLINQPTQTIPSPLEK